MHLQDYFDRIGYSGSDAPGARTLRELLQSHILAVPFENLDVQLGRRLTTAPEDAYAKIVERRRGGWCYEQNGLFGWVLSEMGFDVRRIAAAVMRQERGDSADANHLCLLVRCPGSPQTWLVDVGFGGSMVRPIELAEREYEQTPFRLGLRRRGANAWRFWENPGDGEFTYDFIAEQADEAALSNKCELLQTDPESGFVLNLVVQLRTPERHLSLRGKVLRTSSADGVDSEILTSAEQLQVALRQIFGLHIPEATDLWPKIEARHSALFGADP